MKALLLRVLLPLFATAFGAADSVPQELAERHRDPTVIAQVLAGIESAAGNARIDRPVASSE